MNKELAIIDVLNKSGFKTKVGSSNISICCPLAPYSPLHSNSKDRRPSMGIKVTDTAVLVNCFTCGFKCGQLSFLYKKLTHHNIGYKEALNYVLSLEKEFLKHGLSNLATNGFQVRREPKPVPVCESKWNLFGNKFSKYFLSRDVELETGIRWGVGFDQQNNRAMIPIRDFKGCLWGAVGRSINPNVWPKYFNYFEFKKSQQLLGAQLIDSLKKVVVVEGSFDALKADQALQRAGMDGYAVVSILGSDLSDTQADLLTKCSSEIVLAFDYDQAGAKGTKIAHKKLSKRVLTRVACIGSVGKKDFGECTDDEILSVINSAEFFC